MTLSLLGPEMESVHCLWLTIFWQIKGIEIWAGLATCSLKLVQLKDRNHQITKSGCYVRLTYTYRYIQIAFCRNQSSRLGRPWQSPQERKFRVKSFQYKTCLDFVNVILCVCVCVCMYIFSQLNLLQSCTPSATPNQLFDFCLFFN